MVYRLGGPTTVLAPVPIPAEHGATRNGSRSPIWDFDISSEPDDRGNLELGPLRCPNLVLAGNDTTTNLIANGTVLLAEHSDQRQEILDRPELLDNAIEEMLRLVSPVLSFQRTATKNTTLRDVSIKQGERVLMLYGSANRDAEEFENPETFDIDRNPHHLAFGIGNHFCLGANLARMELRVALNELLRRIPDMSYATNGPELGQSALVRSVQHMFVKYTPEAD